VRKEKHAIDDQGNDLLSDGVSANSDEIEEDERIKSIVFDTTIRRGSKYQAQLPNK
jgi:hypothetical protein